MSARTCRRWTEREKRVAVAMRMRGKTCKEIGSVLGRGWQSVSCKLKELGIDHPTRKVRNGPVPPSLDRLNDRITALERTVAALVRLVPSTSPWTPEDRP